MGYRWKGSEGLLVEEGVNGVSVVEGRGGEGWCIDGEGVNWVSVEGK